MKRRDLIAHAGIIALWALPSPLRAQGSGKTVGFIGAAGQQSQAPLTAAFVDRLRELGWVEGRTVTIDYRWAEGSAERAGSAATDLVSRKVDVIFTNGTPVVSAVKRATSQIPVIFIAGDPVGTGLVDSLSRPGANLTGLSLQSSELAGKHLELLQNVVQELRRVAVLVNVNAQNAVEQMHEAQRSAGSLGIEIQVLEIRRPDDIARAVERAKGNAQALYVTNEPLTLTNRALICTLAAAARLPTIFAYREFVQAGGLLSYGPSFPDLFRRGAEYVDKILRGRKPADLPVEQPTNFELIINLKTAKALGLSMPMTLLARADEVIE
jgi:putative tryptophan/tyrosine transport system substrate-binding protein